MISRIAVSVMVVLGVLTADIAALSITSKPILIAFARRPLDHPYSYQVETDAPRGSSVIYSLETAPEGMSVDATGIVSWVPDHEQAYYNDVTVKAVVGAGQTTQSFRVFVHGINDATKLNVMLKNMEFNNTHTAERPSRHLIFHIGDSQSYQQFWGNKMLGACTGPVPTHYPRMWGAYQSNNNTICSDLLNDGNLGQSFVRTGGHGSNYGNYSGEEASWGVSITPTAIQTNCNGGWAATVAFGHNDAKSGRSAEVFSRNMAAICDTLLNRNIVPIVFVIPDGVPGGNWGSAGALALYPEYADSMVAMAQRKNIPCADLRGGCQTSVNMGAATLTAGSLLNDQVHYRWNTTPPANTNSLHDWGGAMNIAMHELAHLIGYMYDCGAQSPVIGNTVYYPSGLPLDSLSTAWTTIENKPIAVPTPMSGTTIAAAPNPFNPSTEITCIFAGMQSYKVSLDIYDLTGKLITHLYSGTIHGKQAAAKFTWNASGIAAGMYVTMLRANGKVYSQKLILAR